MSPAVNVYSALTDVIACFVLNDTVPDRVRQNALESALITAPDQIFESLYHRNQPTLVFPIAQKYSARGNPVPVRIPAVRCLGKMRNLTALPEIVAAAAETQKDVSTAGSDALRNLGDPDIILNRQIEFAQDQADRGYRANALRVLETAAVFVAFSFDSRQQAGRRQLQIQRIRDGIARGRAA